MKTWKNALRIGLVTTCGLALGGADCLTNPGGDKDGGSGPVVLTADDFVQAACDYFDGCVAKNGRAFHSKDTCKAYFNDFFDCGFTYGGMGTTITMRMQLDESKLEGCLAWIETATCDDAPDQADPCADIMTQVITGVDLVAEGGKCEGGMTDFLICAEGLTCSYPQDDAICATCKALGKVGEACGGDVPCEGDLFCDDSDHCAEPQADGEACTSDNECESGWCKDNLCTAPLERDADCSTGGECRENLRCYNGVCTDKADFGDSCDDGSDCTDDAICHDGTCTAFDLCAKGQVGDPCVGMSCVETAFCDDADTCQAYKDLGEDCTDNAECNWPEAYCGDNDVCAAYVAIGEDCDYTDNQCYMFEAYCDLMDTNTCLALKADGADCMFAFECASHSCEGDICTADTCTMP